MSWWGANDEGMSDPLSSPLVASWYMTVYIWHGYNTQPRLVMLWKQYEFRPHFSPIRLMCNCFFRWGYVLLLFDSDVYELSWLERYFCPLPDGRQYCFSVRIHLTYHSKFTFTISLLKLQQCIQTDLSLN